MELRLLPVCGQVDGSTWQGALMLVMDAPWGGIAAAVEGLHCQLFICTPLLSTKLSVTPYPTMTSKGAAAQQRAASPSSALCLLSCTLALLLQ